MPAVTHSPTGGRQAAASPGGGAGGGGAPPPDATATAAHAAAAANDARAPPPATTTKLPRQPQQQQQQHQQQQQQPKPTSGAPGGDVYASPDPGPGAPLLCALAWSVRADAPFRLATGTFAPPSSAAAGGGNVVEVLRREFVWWLLFCVWGGVALLFAPHQSPYPPLSRKKNPTQPIRPATVYEGGSSNGNGNGNNGNGNNGNGSNTNGNLAPDRRLLPLPHPFPAACVQFLPDRDPSRPDLLASCADVVRVWRLGDGGGQDSGAAPAADAAAAAAAGNDNDDDEGAARSSGIVRVLTKPPPVSAAAAAPSAPASTTTAAAAAAFPATAPAPLTCLDWCGASGGRRLVASSLDGTAAVWDVEAGGEPIAWVRAHPWGAAHGCCWSGGGRGNGGVGVGGALPASPDIFATCGGGGGGGSAGCGSVRIFDLRDGCKRAAVLFELPADEGGAAGGRAAGGEEEEGDEGKAAAAAAAVGVVGAGAEHKEAGGGDDDEDGPRSSNEEDDDDDGEEEEEEEAEAAAAAAAAGGDAPPPEQKQQQQRRKRRHRPPKRAATRKSSPSVVRVAWSAADPRYLACVPQSSPSALVLDVRFPASPLAVLCRHRAAVNSVAWSPADAAALVTAGDDAQALIWDLSGAAGVVGGGGGGAGGGGAGGAGEAGGGGGGNAVDPILTWVGDREVHALQWSAAQPDWIALACGARAQIMLV